ncbi:hypothetical protein D3C87_1771790 [compost metagenome]
MSRFAFLVTIAAFFASKLKIALKRLTFGCSFFNPFATLLEPINAKTFTFPLSIIGVIISEPFPYKVLTVPFGKASLNAFNKG